MNYDSLACIDDGGCIPFVLGCSESYSENYNPNANFQDADLEDATLVEADLKFAKFSGATVTDANFDDTYWHETMWTDGVRYDTNQA